MSPYDKLRIGRHSQPGRAYFVTTVLADREERLFDDFQCARLAIARMRALHQAGSAHSWAFVVMPDHVHWLFQLGPMPLADVVKHFKATTAHAVNRHLGRIGAVWQKNYYDRAIRNDEDIRDVARYVVANPLRAGLVTRVGDYPHWDASWLDEGGDVSECAAWGG